ncbi:MAG: hypothetical protein IKW37_06355 [Bacteroidaceae bacterium]|nr:hypothetical protein [Bacteroidaceae bacterium]
MKQTTHVEEPLFSSTHAYLDKCISVKQVIISSLITICGVGSILFSLALGESNSTFSMLFLTVGIILILVSLYRFFTKIYTTVYKPTGSEVRSDSLYMDTIELQSLQKMMEKNDFAHSSRLVFKEGGNGRLDYLVSKDGKFVAAQLLHFVPYSYEAVSDVYYYTDDDAAVVSRCLGI